MDLARVEASNGRGGAGARISRKCAGSLPHLLIPKGREQSLVYTADVIVDNLASKLESGFSTVRSEFSKEVSPTMANMDQKFDLSNLPSFESSLIADVSSSLESLKLEPSESGVSREIDRKTSDISSELDKFLEESSSIYANQLFQLSKLEESIHSIVSSIRKTEENALNALRKELQREKELKAPIEYASFDTKYHSLLLTTSELESRLYQQRAESGSIERKLEELEGFEICERNESGVETKLMDEIEQTYSIFSTFSDPTEIDETQSKIECLLNLLSDMSKTPIALTFSEPKLRSANRLF